MAYIINITPENNVVNGHNTILAAISEQEVGTLLESVPRFDSEVVIYNNSNNEIVGARHIEMNLSIDDGKRVKAIFSEHGGQLISLEIDKHQLVYKGTFGTIYNEDVARGHDPIGIPQLGTDGMKVHRMHGILETSLTTFESHLSDLENGRVVFSIKGEEFCGEEKYPNTAFYIIHQIDKDGGVITSIQIANDSKNPLFLAPGLHRYTKRHNNVNPLEALEIEGVEIESAKQLLNSIIVPTSQIIQVNGSGQIEGVKGKIYDKRKTSINLIPLSGYIGRDAEIVIWTDNPERYICVEMTWGGEDARGIPGRDYLTVKPGQTAYVSMKQLFSVES